MRTVYIEPITFECYPEQNADFTRFPYESEFFVGKCDEFIKGHRVVPKGFSWVRSDGTVFHGEMRTPWKPMSELDAAQREYEKQFLAEYAEALKIVGVVV